MKIGFIGTGVMGASIVQHLLNANYEVMIFTRTKQKAQALLEAGAKWAATPAAVASESDVIFTMVGYPTDVEEVYFGEQGILATAKEKSIVIDMTTSKPSLAIELYNKAKEKSIHSLDAPVSGGDLGAKNGTLSIMVGGDKAVFESVIPIFKAFGQNIVYHGEPGSGQHTKMTNQIVIASTMLGVCEALAYAFKAGLDPEKVLKSISTGAAGSWSLSNLAPRILKGDYAPGFYIKHFVKDMKIAIEETEKMSIVLPGLNQVKEIYNELITRGYGEDGTQALIRYYTEK